MYGSTGGQESSLAGVSPPPQNPDLVLGHILLELAWETLSGEVVLGSVALSEVYFLSVVCLFSHRPTPYRNGNNTFLGGNSVEGRERKGRAQGQTGASHESCNARHAFFGSPSWGAYTRLGLCFPPSKIHTVRRKYIQNISFVEGED